MDKNNEQLLINIAIEELNTLKRIEHNTKYLLMFLVVLMGFEIPIIGLFFNLQYGT